MICTRAVAKHNRTFWSKVQKLWKLRRHVQQQEQGPKIAKAGPAPVVRSEGSSRQNHDKKIAEPRQNKDRNHPVVPHKAVAEASEIGNL